MGQAERCVLGDVGHLDPETRAIPHGSADLVARVADDDADLADTCLGHCLDAIEKDRLVGDGHQLLGAGVGDRPESRARATRENEALHRPTA